MLVVLDIERVLALSSNEGVLVVSPTKCKRVRRLIGSKNKPKEEHALNKAQPAYACASKLPRPISTRRICFNCRPPRG